jgi:hypothetical protein
VKARGIERYAHGSTFPTSTTCTAGETGRFTCAGSTSTE